MSTIAVVGSGPGLGAAVAAGFGHRGFVVALLSRSLQNVDALAARLKDDGVSARACAADVHDPAALTAALRQAAAELGPVEVLTCSPIPQRECLRPVLETTNADLAAAVAFSLHGSLTAVSQVLPGMRSLGTGSSLFVNGGSGARANPNVAGTSIAFAGLGAYARMLHDVLAPEGIHVGQLIVPGAIRPGDPNNDPGVLAAEVWTMHEEKGAFREFSEPFPD